MQNAYRAPITLILLMFLAHAGTIAHASSLPEPVARGPYAWQRVGGGDLRWLGLHIYEASLWTENGLYAGLEAGQPVALSLWYRRDFSRDELLRITGTAWKLLGEPSRPQQEKWLAALGGVWSNVAKGHNLTAVVVPGRETRFYDHQRLLGSIEDPQFGPAFLAIWLDPRSVVGDLRVQLLGGSLAAAASN